MSLIVAIYFSLNLYLQMAWASIVSDDYEPTGNYVVMQQPYNLVTYLGSLITLDPVGSYHVVKDGMALYFSRDSGHLEAARHLPNSRYKYLQVAVVRMPQNTKFNLIFNNCKQFKWIAKN